MAVILYANGVSCMMVGLAWCLKKKQPHDGDDSDDEEVENHGAHSPMLSGSGIRSSFPESLSTGDGFPKNLDQTAQEKWA